MNNNKLTESEIGHHIFNIVNKELKEFKQKVKGKKTASPYYLMVNDKGETTKVVNLFELPKEAHSSFLNPILKEMDIEYLILVAESTTLSDTIKRDRIDWDEIYKKYGSLENHPAKVDLVSVIIYSKSNTYIGSAPIKVMSSKKSIRTFGDLKWKNRGEGFEQGNLTGFFQ